jgi:hypothetical protein
METSMINQLERLTGQGKYLGSISSVEQVLFQKSFILAKIN